MKIIQSSIFRAIVAIAMGVLLVKDPSGTLRWITILLGVLFLVMGVMSCINYFVRIFQERKEAVEIDEKGVPCAVVLSERAVRRSRCLVWAAFFSDLSLSFVPTFSMRF